MGQDIQTYVRYSCYNRLNERAVPSESNGVDGGDPLSKLTQLLLAAAVLVALILLAYEMLLG